MRSRPPTQCALPTLCTPPLTLTVRTVCGAGKENRHAWGTEIAMRSKLEDVYAETRRVPIVSLVVQGGPGTLSQVMKGHQ